MVYVVKRFLIGFLIIIGLTAPCYSMPTDDQYIHFFAGAAGQLWLEKMGVSKEYSFLIILGVSVIKENLDSKVDGSEIEAAMLGAGIMYCFGNWP